LKGGIGLGTDEGSNFASALRRASSRGARGKGSSASALHTAASTAARSSSVRSSMSAAYSEKGRPGVPRRPPGLRGHLSERITVALSERAERGSHRGNGRVLVHL
jgi:hypothetical protein